MANIIFILIAIILIALTILYSVKKKTTCPECGSKKAKRTGKKIYKESPAIAVFGSPDSYHEFEHKCENCGHVFGNESKAVIFN